MPTRGGVWKALERGARIGCDAVQLFVKNNMQWFGRPYTPAELAAYANQLAQRPFRAVFAHAGYLINLAGPPSPKRSKSVRSLIQEINLADQLRLPFLILHPGSHLGEGEEAGIKRAAQGLDEAFAATTGSPVGVALECTAGQGTALGGRLEHLAAIRDKTRAPERVGFCLDTAHLFAAGFDLRTREGWDEIVRQAETLLGLDRVWAIHLNDSKTPLGSRTDRHEGIGKGRIGLEAFRYIVNDPRFANTPGCIETPKSDDLHEDVENLALLRSLLAG